uniref:Mannosyl-3-phosphoglycerate synthase n=1 Tax=Fervidicoccus fontis TaxID=683846 RepID=A0A7J3ZK02_9CREN
MRLKLLIEKLGDFEDFGSLRVYKPIRIIMLDAMGYEDLSGSTTGANAIGYSSMLEVARRTAIAVPVKDEPLFKFKGVIAGVPRASPLIVISASARERGDNYENEVEAARDLYERSGRKIILTWQRDPAWGEAIKGTRLDGLLEEDTGLVRYGKGEGMLLGVLLAAYYGLDYIGFVDSDNYTPATVHEYVWAYYAGFVLSRSSNCIVRLKWSYKGKLESSELPYLRRRGRVSKYTNEALNYAISLARKVETDIINTANSGEHAITLNLALNMEWAGGYSVEPYQLVYLLEKCWMQREFPSCVGEGRNVDVIQVETLSPHIHEEREEEHLLDMLKQSLATIMYSALCNDMVRERIKSILREYLGDKTLDLEKPRVYPPPGRELAIEIVERYISKSRDFVIFG